MPNRSYFAHIDLFDLLRDLDAEEGSAARDAGAVPAMLTIPLLPRGKFEHPCYGDLDWNDEKFGQMVRNFDSRVTGYQPMLNADHASQNPFAAGAPAYGWFQGIAATSSGLEAQVELTRLGQDAIRDRLYRYISAEVAEEYTDSKGETTENVICGGALTNLPFHDTMRGLFAAKPQARCFSTSGPASFWAADRESTGGSMTLLEKIRQHFKLPDAATEADAVAALEAVPPPEAATETEKAGAAVQTHAQPPAAETVTLSAAEIAAFRAAAAEVETLKRDRDELKAEVKASTDREAAANKTLLENAARESVDGFVKSGKIAPAQRETALKFALADPVLFKEHYEYAPAVLDFKQRGFGGDGKPAGGETTYHGEILALCQKEGLDYATAGIRIAEDHPDLYERHRAQAFGGGGRGN